MKNSEKFYGEIRRYLENVAEITGEYDTTMSRAEPYKGSEAHKRIEAEATAKRDAAVTAEKERALAEIRAVIESMRENTRNRRINPPTPTQLAILETLKMRQKISKDEIQQAANNLRDCPLALSVLQELANAHHIVYTGGELGQTLTTDFIMQRVNCLEENAFKMIRGDNARFSRVPADMGDCLTRCKVYAGNRPVSPVGDARLREILIERVQVLRSKVSKLDMADALIDSSQQLAVPVERPILHALPLLF